MFVVKDTRKVTAILVDPADSRQQLKLARRPEEFHGTTSGLLCDDNMDALSKMVYLSLYDNRLTRLTGIHHLASTPLVELTLGRNLLKALPAELGLVKTLKVLWVDDNELTEFPECVLELPVLERLRLSGNRITAVPRGISVMQSLSDLNMDSNLLSSLPDSIGALSSLKIFSARGNQLAELPSTIVQLEALESFCVSSNKLTALPPGMRRMVNLKELYANGNGITRVPVDVLSLAKLKKINLANNRIAMLPRSVIAVWKATIPPLDEDKHSEPDVDGSVDLTADVDMTAGAAAGSAGGEAVPARLSVLDKLTADTTSAPTGAEVILTGNPVTVGYGCEITEAQFTQPMTASWGSRA